MYNSKSKVFFAVLIALILFLSAWLLTQFASRIAITTQFQYTAYSGAAPASATATPGVTSTAPTPGASPTAPTSTAKPTPPPVSSPLPPTTSDEQQIEQDVFQAINYDRTSAGLPALQWSSALLAGAHKHNLLMSADDDMAHQLPGEPGIADRITADGVKWTWCGENIGWTSRTNSTGALGLHNSMMAEQPPDDAHRKNILSTNFTMVGIDIYIDSNHKLWLTEDFAN